VADASTCEHLKSEANRVVCLYTPRELSSVGPWYEEFSQTSDEEVRRLLDAAGKKLV
jgi:predicted phosphoribosyltransferase